MALACATVASAHAVVIFDDFTSGPYGVTLIAGSDLAEQSGKMVGGYRQTYFEIVDNPFSRLSGFEIFDGAFVESGVRAETRTRLYYGFRLADESDPDGDDDDAVDDLDNNYLNADLSGMSLDGLAINFLSNDLDLEYEITVVSAEGANTARANGVIGSGVDFTSVVPFASFVGTVDLADVDQIIWEFDAAPNGDFAISSVGAVPEPGTMAVLALGAAALLRRRRKNA